MNSDLNVFHWEHQGSRKLNLVIEIICEIVKTRVSTRQMTARNVLPLFEINIHYHAPPI